MNTVENSAKYKQKCTYYLPTNMARTTIMSKTPTMAAKKTVAGTPLSLASSGSTGAGGIFVLVSFILKYMISLNFTIQQKIQSNKFADDNSMGERNTTLRAYTMYTHLEWVFRSPIE